MNTALKVFGHQMSLIIININHMSQLHLYHIVTFSLTHPTE